MNQLDDCAPPLSDDEFADLLDAVSAPTSFVIAVSGGRDSMALARLCARLQAFRSHLKITAVTVDHGLRAGSAKEAAQTGAWCRALGLNHETRLWEGRKPASGIQNAAREARYRLLIQTAETLGAKAVLTAHSGDDQAETVFMRMRRGGSPLSLSGMAQQTKIAVDGGDPVALLRPFLGISRERLTRTAGRAERDYIDDPSNEDPTFERVQIRRLLAQMADDGTVTREALLRTATTMRDVAQQEKSAEDRAFIRNGGCFYRWGGVSIDVSVVDDPALGGLAARIVFAVSGAKMPVSRQRAEGAVCTALSDGRATLSGALIERHGDKFWFIREPAALLGRAGVSPMASMPVINRMLWDNRFRICGSPTEGYVSISPLGALSDPPRRRAKWAFPDAPNAALETLPCVTDSQYNPARTDFLFNPGSAIILNSLVKERFDGGIIRFS